MLTVSTLLSKPLFKEFHVVAGDSGLGNIILSSGYFEWEEDEDIVKTFGKGEFVITSLYAVKDNLPLAEKYIKLLINNHVSAIAIKNIYYNDISDELKKYAEQRQVPIMFFENTYIDDIIVSIRNELTNNSCTPFNGTLLNSLIFDNTLTILEKEKLMKEINVFFSFDTIFAAYISTATDINDISAASAFTYDIAIENLRNTIPSELNSMSIVYSFITYKRGLFFIATFNTKEEHYIHDVTTLLQKILSEGFSQEFHIGISTSIHGIADISTLLWNAIYSNISCILNQKHLLTLQNTGTDSILFSNCYSENINNYYNKILRVLSATENSSSLVLDTLIAFAKHGGNIEATAAELFQHKNTIRYRLRRLSKLLNIDNEIQLHYMIWSFSRIHFGRKYLKVFICE